MISLLVCMTHRLTHNGTIRVGQIDWLVSPESGRGTLIIMLFASLFLQPFGRFIPLRLEYLSPG